MSSSERLSTAMSAPDPYVFRMARLMKVVDGDTIDAELHLGFGAKIEHRLKFIDINAPEIRTKDADEKRRGHLARDFVVEWFERPGQVWVLTTKEEKYGRMLADCFRVGEPSLCTELLTLGLAVPYRG